MRTDTTNSTRLSTGTTVDLPLQVSFGMGGFVVPASYRRLVRVLPEPLRPVSLLPGVGAVTLVGIQYHRVGTGSERRRVPDSHESDPGNAFDPYDEFAAIVPCRFRSADRNRERRTGEVPKSDGRWLETGIEKPVRWLLERLPVPGSNDGFGGYVVWLPVTTHESVALGREVWGYPKERADITVTDGPAGFRTVVRVGSSATLKLAVARPWLKLERTRSLTLDSYTIKEGLINRSVVEIRGRIAIGTGSGCSLRGDIDETPLRSLGIWNRPLVGFTGSRFEASLTDGEPVAASERWIQVN